MKFCYRRSRSLPLVSTTGTSACEERRRPKARPPNPAIEHVSFEKQKRYTNTFSLLRPKFSTSMKEKEKVVQKCSRSLKRCKATRKLSRHRSSCILSTGVQRIKSNWGDRVKEAHIQSPRPNLGVRRAFFVPCPPLLKSNSTVHIYKSRKRQKLYPVHNQPHNGLHNQATKLQCIEFLRSEV